MAAACWRRVGAAWRRGEARNVGVPRLSQARELVFRLLLLHPPGPHAKQRGVFASSAEDGIRLMLARKAILVSEMDRFFKELELQKEMAQGQRREHRQEQQRKVA